MSESLSNNMFIYEPHKSLDDEEMGKPLNRHNSKSLKQSKKHLEKCQNCKDSNSHLLNSVNGPKSVVSRPMALTLYIEDFLSGPIPAGLESINKNGMSNMGNSMTSYPIQSLPLQPLAIAVLAALLILSAIRNSRLKSKLEALKKMMPLEAKMIDKDGIPEEESEDFKAYKATFTSETSEFQPVNVKNNDKADEEESEDFKEYKATFKTETKEYQDSGKQNKEMKPISIPDTPGSMPITISPLLSSPSGKYGSEEAKLKAKERLEKEMAREAQRLKEKADEDAARERRRIEEVKEKEEARIAKVEADKKAKEEEEARLVEAAKLEALNKAKEAEQTRLAAIAKTDAEKKAKEAEKTRLAFLAKAEVDKKTKEAEENRLIALAKTEADKKAREAEKARLAELDRAEKERKAKEAEEARLAAIAKADAEKKAKEAEKARLAELAKMEAEKKAREAEEARLAAIAKAEADRKAKEAEETARKIALAKAEADRKIKEAEEAAARAEAERKAREAEEARLLALAQAEAERKAKHAEEMRLSTLTKSEADKKTKEEDEARSAKQIELEEEKRKAKEVKQVEEARLTALAKAAAEQKAKEAKEVEDARIAKENENARIAALAKAEAERKAKEEEEARLAAAAKTQALVDQKAKEEADIAAAAAVKSQSQAEVKSTPIEEVIIPTTPTTSAAASNDKRGLSRLFSFGSRKSKKDLDLEDSKIEDTAGRSVEEEAKLVTEKKKNDTYKAAALAESKTGITTLTKKGKTKPQLGQVASRFDGLIELLKQFKCNKAAAQKLADRLKKCAAILAGLFNSKDESNIPEVNYKILLDELCGVMVEAKKYFSRFAKDGFLETLFTGLEPKSKFEFYDTEIAKILAELIIAFYLKPDDWNTLPPIEYNEIMVLDDTIIERAKSDPGAMKALAKDLSVNVTDLQGEIAGAVKTANYLRQDTIETGPQRQLKHPAVKAFWRMRLSEDYKVDYKNLIDMTAVHIKEHDRPNISKAALDAICAKFLRILELVDENHDENITVFEFNQNTKRFDPDWDYLTVIENLCLVTTMKIYPAVSDKMRRQMIWGEGLEKVVMDTIMNSGKWTIVYGPSQAGKTFRWNVGVDQLGSSNAVIWVDFKGVKTTNDILATIATQLSLSVLSLDDVTLEFQRLLDSNLNENIECCIVLDHVDLNNLTIYTTFLRILKKAQQKNRISVIVMTTSEIKPSTESIDALQKAGKVVLPATSIVYQQIGAFNDAEALALANLFDVHNPSVLVKTACNLPGAIGCLQSLRGDDLALILDIEDKMANNAAYVPVTSKSDVIMKSLSEYEKLVAISLYYPLECGAIFHKSLAWELCKDSMSDQIYVWNNSMNRLIELGWIQRVGDEGLIIGENSVLPQVSKPIVNPKGIEVTITEMDQWEKYYRFWTSNAIYINDLLQTRMQLLGCSFFDSAKRHFEIVFKDWAAVPPMYNRLRPIVVLELTCRISSNVSHALEYRFVPAEGLDLSKGVMRILCDNDDTGLLKDDRYWKVPKPFCDKQIVIRAAVNVGWFHHRTGNTTTAEVILITALQHLSESDELNYAYALNKMAIVLRALNRKEESLATHEQCLRIRIEKLGEKHTETAQSLNNIAIVLLALGRREDALSMHQRCLGVRLELLGEKHVSSGDSFYNMASAYIALSRKDDARNCYEKAKVAYIATYGEGHAFVKDVTEKLSQLDELIKQSLSRRSFSETNSLSSRRSSTTNKSMKDVNASTSSITL